MAQITLTASADADLVSVFDHLHTQAGKPVVVKYRSLLSGLYERLEDHPESGAPCPILGPDIRIGLVSPYVVIYRYDKISDTVFILRIVHHRRRIPRKSL